MTSDSVRRDAERRSPLGLSPLFMSLVEFVDALGNDGSAHAAAAASLARVRATGDGFSGFVRIDAERALPRAADLDRQRLGGAASGALHGAVLAHKDMFFQAGLATECGSRILRGFRPQQTATVLSRLEAAGAVDLGALHMAEFAMSPMGYNAQLGHGRNPWSAAHVTGGSSSGSGAAVASRLVFGALGSDTGGSVRIPAAACGVTGIKPTQHAVSVHGVMPLSPSLDCVGFLAQTARDCARLLSVVSGPDPLDPSCLATRPRDHELGIGRPLSPADVIAVPDFPTDAPITDEVRALVERAAADLRGAGAVLRRVGMPDLVTAGTLATLMLGVEAASIHGDWLRTRADEYGAQVRRRIERGLLYPGTAYLDAQRLRGAYQARFLHEQLQGAAALLLPVLPCAVPTIEETTAGTETEIEVRFGNFSLWTRSINYLGLPALALPAGFTANGLPSGVQLVGRPFAEAALLRIGHQYQQCTAWHAQRPPCARLAAA